MRCRTPGAGRAGPGWAGQLTGGHTERFRLGASQRGTSDRASLGLMTSQRAPEPGLAQPRCHSTPKLVRGEIRGRGGEGWRGSPKREPFMGADGFREPTVSIRDVGISKLVLLVLLYAMQGVPIGLALGSVPLMLKTGGATLTDLVSAPRGTMGDSRISVGGNDTKLLHW